MMKKILFSLILLVLAGGSFLAYRLYTHPERMYTKWLNGVEFDEWFFIPSYDVTAFSNQIKAIDRNIHRGKDAENLWKAFHVKDVILPLPFRHPLYSVVPILIFNGTNQESTLGFDFVDNSRKKIFSIQFRPEEAFKFKDNKQKIFKIPIFKQLIDSVPEKNKWRDIFEMTFQDTPTNVKQMVYKLFILDQRMNYLAKNTKTFGYIPEIDVAVVEMIGKNKDYKEELVLYLRGRKLHSFLLTSKLADPEAKFLRGRILRGLQIEPDTENMARAIYEEFKALPYSQQISNDGLLYLFSAWSHTPDDKEFFRVMVQFLERGNDNLFFLEPLYEFAYARFGSSFSRFDYRLKEKAEEEFKRKMEEEQKKEAKDLMDQKIEDINLNDLRPEEKIQYQLRKAKEKKSNSKDDKVIIVD